MDSGGSVTHTQSYVLVSSFTFLPTLAGSIETKSMIRNMNSAFGNEERTHSPVSNIVYVAQKKFTEIGGFDGMSQLNYIQPTGEY